MERHPDSAFPPGFPADPTAAQTAPRRNWLHRLVNFAVAIVVLAVAAGTFFLSYPGVHAVALQGGVSAQLARIYPGVFDAVLVIACVAAVMLRDARWWARCWAWVVVIVVLAAIGITDVLHAMNYGLHRADRGRGRRGPGGGRPARLQPVSHDAAPVTSAASGGGPQPATGAGTVRGAWPSSRPPR